MSKFDVTIHRQVFECLIVEVDADTAAEADAKVQAVIEACHYDADTIAEHYGIDCLWEVEEADDFTVESVEQLSRT